MSDQTRSIPVRLPFQAHGWKILAGGLAVIGLYLTSRYSYVLFHTLVELFSIIIGWALFLMMWNARKWVDNRYLLVLGTALAAAGGLDLVHTLAYKGLNLFPGFDSNLPTQLWIAARYLQSLSMLFALIFLTARNQSALIPSSDPGKPGRYFDAGVLVFYAIAMVGLLSLIFLRQFPVCYIEGQGLTPFKIISEYVISFILLISLAMLWLKRLHFDRALLYLLIAATGLTILSELAFTFYVGVYDFSNLVGHYGKLAAFFLIYLAVIQSGLQRPYSILFRNLSQQTAALKKSEAQYRLLVESANDMVYSTTPEGIFQYVSPAWTRLTGYSIPEVLNHPFHSFIHPGDLPACTALFEETIRSGKDQSDIQYRVIHKDGSWRWHTSNASVIKDTENKVVSFIGIARDITERKRAEEALHENEAKFRALFHNVPMSGVIYRLIRDDQKEIVDWELQDINARGAANLGQLPSELIGKRATALFGAEVMQPYLDLSREVVATNQPRHLETHFPHNDKYYLSAVFSLGTNFYANMSVDITERKRVEEALSESESRFRLLYENINEGIALHEIITDENNVPIDFIFLSANPTYERLTQLRVADIVGKRGLEVIPNLEKKWIDAYGKVAQTGQPVTLIDHSDYLNKYWEVRAFFTKPNQFAVALNDITERIRSEQAMQVSEQQHRRLIEILHSGVVVHGPNTEILLANQKASILLGLSLAQMQGKVAIDPDWCFIREDGTRLPLDEYPVMLTVASHKPLENYVAGIDQPMGNRIWVLVNTYPDFDDNNELRQVVVTFMDITERKRVEEIIHVNQIELQRLLAETEHSRQALLSVVEDQKEAEEQVRQMNTVLEQRVKERTAQLEIVNNELEAFSYSVSHDLRAPLRALDGFSAALKSDYQGQLDQQAQHYLTRIQEASKRMGQLIEDLLNLSRITRREVDLGRVDLSLLARQIAGELHAQSPERQVEFEISPDLIVRADPGLIKIAMENLLHNALKYSSKKDVALIQVGVLDQPGPEGRVFYVRDNGAGFDMAYADKLFTPFQRLHGTQEFSGTGIGLTIVQRIITRHGGRIWPEAAVNQGATFYFTLGGE